MIIIVLMINDKNNIVKGVCGRYSLDSAAAYCLNFLPSRLVPFGPLTDSILLKTDKSMVGPAFQMLQYYILLRAAKKRGFFFLKKSECNTVKKPALAITCRARAHDDNNILSAGDGDSAGLLCA